MMKHPSLLILSCWNWDVTFMVSE